MRIPSRSFIHVAWVSAAMALLYAGVRTRASLSRQTAPAADLCGCGAVTGMSLASTVALTAAVIAVAVLAWRRHRIDTGTHTHQ